MKRSRVTGMASWSFIGGIVCATHVHLPIRQHNEFTLSGFVIAGVLSFYMVGRHLREAWVSAITLVMISAGIAFGFGTWLEAMNPNHPTVPLGQRVAVHASVTKVEQKPEGTVVILAVDGEGNPSRRCTFPVIWIVHAAPSELHTGTEGEWVGLLTSMPPSKSVVQDWLNPIWILHGSLKQITSVALDAKWDSAIRTALVATVSSQQARFVDVALSMVIGHAAPISPAMQNLFLQAGVTHLLAASGANVVIFLRTISLVLRFVKQFVGPSIKWIETFILLASVFTFVWVCGFSAPIVRAALFSAYGLFGSMFGRNISGSVAMSIVCVMFAIWHPYQFTTVSALFSLIATYAMYLAISTWAHQGRHDNALNPPLTPFHLFPLYSPQRWFRALVTVVGHLMEVLYISVVIDLTMLPLVWWWFGQLTPYGAIGTVVTEPFVLVLLPTTIVWILLSLAAHQFAAPFASCATWTGHITILMIFALVQILKRVSSLPGSFLIMPSIPVWMVMMYLSLFITWFKWRSKLSIFRQ